MNKKGFISISAVYSFFFIFVTIILSIIVAYSSRRIMLINIKDDIRKVIDSKTSYDCFSKGITKLNECIIETYGGEEAITTLNNVDLDNVTIKGEKGLFKADEVIGNSYFFSGTTYYFRGDVNDNYVKFGQNDDGIDMYWRIVRINGDKSIRLIYAGTELAENGSEHEQIIGETAYHSNTIDVGYTYGNNNSNIKELLDTWYENNLMDYYSDYLADAVFCNDRSLATYSYGSNGQIDFYGYHTGYRLQSPNLSPTFSCRNSNDRYAKSSSHNGRLTYPIGTITGDEIVFAGGKVGESNNSYYLYSNDAFWTITPISKHDTYAGIWGITNDTGLTRYRVETVNGVRPVINLKAVVEIKRGNGTINNPYELEEVNY